MDSRMRRPARRSLAMSAVVAVAGLVATLPRGDAVQAFTSNSASAMYTVGPVSVAAPGVPGALSFCAPTSWSYTSDNMPAFMATVNLQGTFFVWNVVMTMSVAGCENANGGAGSITGGTIAGASPGGGSLNCNLTGGGYTRVGAVITMTIATTCSTDGVPAPIVFTLAGTWLPDVSNLQGVLTPITSATLAGAMVSVPS
jgi:hypothetical protein